MRRKLEPEAERILFVSGGELEAMRRSQGLSRPDLAELTGLHRNTIANVERGLGDCSILAMSLMQVHLRARGVTVGKEGFLLCPPPAGDPRYPYPHLVVPPSAMIGEMGRRVRQLRIERGMSISELAEAARVHRNTVWNFERGLAAPSATFIHSVYSLLGVQWVGGSEDGLIFA
jgi:transcriptional regulator with XRE-family HTH domain